MEHAHCVAKKSVGIKSSVVLRKYNGDAMRRFHIRKTDGTLVSGASAFAELWLNLPRFKLLGGLSKLPFISQFAELTYRLFLKIRPFIQRRFQKN